MSLVWNPNGIKSNVIPGINSAKSDLTAARNALAIINIPGSFSQRNQLSNFPGNIRTAENNANNIVTWLEEANRNMERLEAQTMVPLSLIGTPSIPTNNNLDPLARILNRTSAVGVPTAIVDNRDWLQTATTVGIVALAVMTASSSATAAPAVDNRNWLQRTAATAGNFVVGLVGEVFKAGEVVVDTAATVGTAVVSVPTLAWDYGIVGGYNAIFNGGYKAGGATSAMWDSVNSFTSTEYIQGNIDWFYGTSAGQWLDTNAYFKSSSWFSPVDWLITGANNLGDWAEAGLKNIGAAISSTWSSAWATVTGWFTKKDLKLYDVSKMPYLENLDITTKKALQEELNSYRALFNLCENMRDVTQKDIDDYKKLFNSLEFCVWQQEAFYDFHPDNLHPDYYKKFHLDPGTPTEWEMWENTKQDILAANKEKLDAIGVTNFEEFQAWMNSKRETLAYLNEMLRELEKIIIQLPYTYVVNTSDFDKMSDFSHYLNADWKKYQMYINGEKVKNPEKLNGLAMAYYLKTDEKFMANSIGYFMGDSPFIKYLDYIPYISDEQFKIYNYLFATQGKDIAEKYFLSIKDDLHQVMGLCEAAQFLNSLNKSGNFGKFWKSFGSGTWDGINNFFQGMDNIFKAEDIRTVLDYKQMFIIQALTKQMLDEEVLTALNSGLLNEEQFKALCESKGFKDPELVKELAKYGGYEQFLSHVYKFGITFGNMVPAITTAAVLSAAGLSAPVITVFGTKMSVASIVSSSLIGLSVMGNESKNALVDGAPVAQAKIYGFFVGASEATLQILLGNIPGLNPEAAFSIRGFLSEGIEEGIQEIISAILAKVILGQEIDITVGQVGEAFVMGVLMSVFMTGGQAAINYGGQKISLSKDAAIRILSSNDIVAAFKAEFASKANINSNTTTTTVPTETKGSFNEFIQNLGPKLETLKNRFDVIRKIESMTFPEGMHEAVITEIKKELFISHYAEVMDVLNYTEKYCFDKAIGQYVTRQLTNAGFSYSEASMLSINLFHMQANEGILVGAIAPENLVNAALEWYVTSTLSRAFKTSNAEVDARLKEIIINNFKNGQATFNQLNDPSYCSSVIKSELATINARIDQIFPGEYSEILNSMKKFIEENVLLGRLSLSALEGNGLFRNLTLSYEENILRDVMFDMSGFKPNGIIDLSKVAFDASKYNLDFDITLVNFKIDQKLLNSMDLFYDWSVLASELTSDQITTIKSEVYYFMQENNIDLSAIDVADARYLVHQAVTNRLVDINPFAQTILRVYGLDRINHQFLLENANKLHNASLLTSAADFIDQTHFTSFMKQIELSAAEFAEYMDTYMQIFHPQSYNEYIKLAQLNKFTRVDMPLMLLNFTNGLSLAYKIEISAFRNQFMTEDAYRRIAAESSMAHNTGYISQYSLAYNYELLLANIIHENLHQISRDGVTVGVQNHNYYSGINEAITQFFTKLLAPQSVSGYDLAVERGIQPLVDAGVLTVGELKVAYFVNHDIISTMNRIFNYDHAAINKFLDAFDKATYSGNDANLLTLRADALKTLDLMIVDILNRAYSTPSTVSTNQSNRFVSDSSNFVLSSEQSSNVVPTQMTNTYIEITSILDAAKMFGDAGIRINELLAANWTVDQIIANGGLSPIEITEFNNFLKNTPQGQFIASLKHNELVIINDYTGHNSKKVNTALREMAKYLEEGNTAKAKKLGETKIFIEGFQESIAVKHYAQVLEGVLSRVTLGTDMMLYRGVNINAFDSFGITDVSDLHRLVGEVFRENGFMSTSLFSNINYIENCDVIFKIAAHADINGAYINQLSRTQFYNAEFEVLLARGVNLRIIGVTTEVINGVTKYIIECEAY